jgi:hypothetical protein
MVGLQTLDLAIGVRVPASQPISRFTTATTVAASVSKHSVIAIMRCFAGLDDFVCYGERRNC